MGTPSSHRRSGSIQPMIKGKGMSENPVSCGFPIKNNSRGANRQRRAGKKGLETVWCQRFANELKCWFGALHYTTLTPHPDGSGSGAAAAAGLGSVSAAGTLRAQRRGRAQPSAPLSPLPPPPALSLPCGSAVTPPAQRCRCGAGWSRCPLWPPERGNGDVAVSHAGQSGWQWGLPVRVSSWG